MKITQRQIGLSMVGLLAIVSFLVGITSTFEDKPLQMWIGLIAGVLFSLLLIPYWGGVNAIRYVVIIAVVLFGGFGPQEPFVTEVSPLANATAPIVATLLGGIPWIAGSTAAVHLILLARAGFSGVYTEPLSIGLSLMVGGGLILSRMITDRAVQSAEENAEQVAQALTRAEEQARELAEQTEELRIQNEQQQRLIDLVTTLETPAVIVAEGVLLAPIVGHLDSRRAQSLTTRILSEVSVRRTRLVILDIAGVSTIDTQVAHALIQAARAIRLLGCNVTLTGISASVATTITHLGIALEGMQTARTPQDALASAMIEDHNGNIDPTRLN